MRRYKTKQELKADRLASIKLPFGEPLDVQALSINLTTTNPHPYEGRGIKICVTPAKSWAVQEKAFKLGYAWHRKEQTIQETEAPFLFLWENKDIAKMPAGSDFYFANHKYTELTPQQFLEGYWPPPVKQYMEDWANKGDASKAKPPDAYYNEQSGFIHYWEDGRERQEILKLAYVYNLLSEKEFKEKHPEQHPEQLMFKDWKVKTDPNYIRVGCESFEKPKLNEWLKISKRILGRDVSLGVAYDWISKREDILGL